MNRMTRLVWLLLATAAGAQAAPAYRLDPDNTRVHFEVLHFGTSTSRGRFGGVAGSIEFDAVARREGLDAHVGELAVGDGDHRAVEGAEARAAQADRLDGADEVLDAHELALAHGLIHADRHRAEHVLDADAPGDGAAEFYRRA